MLLIAEYLRDASVKESLELVNLGIGDEDQLLLEYFECSGSSSSWQLKKIYYEKYNSNKNFISFLLDLDFEVFRGDLVPTLFIFKEGVQCK